MPKPPKPPVRRRQIDPRITIRRQSCVINWAAAELLQQDGEGFVAVIWRNGRVLLRPLYVEGLMTIVPMNRMPDGRIQANLGIAETLMLPSSVSSSVAWNDDEGALEIRMDLPAPARERTRARRVVPEKVTDAAINQ